MEKDPHDRYATARELADDLRRFLEDRPIVAKRPSLWGKAVKLARRHRGVVRALCAGLAVALVALATSTALVWRAYRTELEQRQRADANYREARDQRRQARRAVDKMYLEVADKWLDRQPQMSELQKQFLQEVLAYYRDFAEEKGEDEEARFERAMAYLRVGHLLIYSLAKDDQAQGPLRKASALLEELAQQFPDKGIYTCKLAEAQNLLGFSEGHHKVERAVSLMEGLVERCPAEPEYRYQLAIRLSNLSMVVTREGKLKEGESICRRAIAISERLIQSPSPRPEYHRILASASETLADNLRQGGDWREAAEAYHKAIAAYQGLTPDSSGVPEYEYDLKPLDLFGNWYKMPT
jgi:tetratricopeptide (TPR) repeat protein